ncbi:MAG: peptide chain release factor N(5)-glutamine methyltransferase [Halieaceae bacterium]
MSSVRDLLAGSDLPGATARLDAELLLCHCLDQQRAYLYTWPERELSAAELEEFSRLMAARREGQPLAYLTGQREFWSMPLAVNEHTLIPRPETETLVQWALELPIVAAASVLDWGTGSGAIALALASERPAWQVLASDSSTAALAVAAGNASALGLDRVQFLASNWGDSFAAECCDLIVSNPPYVAAQDPHLQQGDLRFEPATALVAGADGLDAIRLIIESAGSRLRAGGWLLLEHGFDQADSVRALLQASGYQNAQSRRDLAGIERISGAQLP